MPALFLSTVMANSSFYVKWCLTEKVPFLFFTVFDNFDKVFVLGRGLCTRLQFNEVLRRRATRETTFIQHVYY